MVKDQTKQISIVPWISWHTYKLSGESKTIIYEQRSHHYYLLSEEGTIIWDCLINMSNNELIDISALKILIEDNIILCRNNICTNKCIPNENLVVQKFTELPDTIHKQIKSEGYIFDVHWDITNKCNEKCIHCYNINAHNGLRNHDADELSFYESKQLVDELYYLGVFRLVLSGGEVLTKKFFIPLCKYIREKNIQLIIYTNGLAFSKQKLNHLSRLYPSNVCFSVYGHKGRIHDNITQVANSYNKVLFATSYLKKHFIETCHKNTLLTNNYKWWHETWQKGKILADKSMVNCTIYPSLDGCGLSIYQLTESQLTEIALHPESPIYFKRDIRGACNIFKNTNETPCYSMTNTIYVNPYGEICLCIALPIVIARLRDGDIKKLKRHEKNAHYKNDFTNLNGNERLDNWRSLKISDLKECGRYKYCSFCIDVCPGDAFLLNGDILSAPSNHCVIAKARYMASTTNKND